MGHEPALCADQVGNATGVRPVFRKHSAQRLLQIGYCGEKAVADAVLDHVPELLDGVELGTLGRQLEHSHIGGQAALSVSGVEARPVPNHHMGRLRIAPRDLGEKKSAAFQVHRGAVIPFRLRNG